MGFFDVMESVGTGADSTAGWGTAFGCGTGTGKKSRTRSGHWYRHGSVKRTE